ncbi:hypothetical protein HanIR_Chr11g0559051 [Helianthus annuus]|nr:hypothetical protein HanIR_Chr11g0559051 [Helianthus annuus]
MLLGFVQNLIVTKLFTGCWALVVSCWALDISGWAQGFKCNIMGFCCICDRSSRVLM